jgi:cellulose synthase/poly-beta-1,6-N-acetylglucosamine synthase-like glycosyltransferase
MPRAAILVVARDDAAGLREQLEALVRCDLPPDIEVVVAQLSSRPAVSALLAQLEGEVRIVRGPAAAGAWAAAGLAAAHTHAPVTILLGPLARPRPGFAEPLAAAVASGAAIAVPVIGGAHGHHAAADGALVARTAGDERSLDAVALDCLAAAPDAWAALPELDPREGFVEQRVVATSGEVVVARESVVDRAPARPASIIVATRDRADEVGGLLELIASAAPEAEVIVADNGSRDDTAAVVRGFPGARLVCEPRPGAAFARDAAAAVATRPLLLYLDDDARPAPGWFEHATRAFDDSAVVHVGGPLVGIWPPGRPADWPPRSIQGYFSLLGLGEVDAELTGGLFYSANFGFRAQTLAALGGFHRRIGASDTAAVGAEDSCVSIAVRERGLGSTRYVRGAAAGHRIDPARIDEAYLARRAFKDGAGSPQVAIGVAGGTPETVRADADRAAAMLAPLFSAGIELDPAAVLEQVVASAVAVDVKVAVGSALGRVAASAVLLGQDRWPVGGAALRARPEHAAGELPPFAPRPAWR